MGGEYHRWGAWEIFVDEDVMKYFRKGLRDASHQCAQARTCRECGKSEIRWAICSNAEIVDGISKRYSNLLYAYEQKILPFEFIVYVRTKNLA